MTGGRGRGPRRAAAGAAALLVAGFVLAAPAAASSGTQADVQTTTSASSAAWGVAPTAQSVTTAPPCATTPSSCGPFTSTSVLGLSTIYFNVWNTGDVSLSGLSYTVALSSGEFTLTACSLSWSGLGTCAGTTTTVLSSQAAGTYAVTGGVPTATGAGVYLKMTTSLLVTSVTVSTSACSGGSACTDGTTSRQIRAATTTNA